MGATFIFCYYLFGVLTVTGIGYTNSIRFRPNISWTPFIGMITGPVDTALNIFLFIPFGLFLPLLFKKFNNIKATALAGLLFSLSVELVQLFNWGSSDINDLMTNTGGACIGYLIYCLLAKVLPSKLKKQLQAKHFNSNVLVGLYVICTFVIMVTGQRWVVHGLLNIP